jgi:Ala-tRNA(Pro) deacylase
MANSVTDQLQELLTARQIPFQVLQHAPVFTSEEAAAIRGTSLASGAKALICRADGRFVMFVLPADRRLASKQVRRTAAIGSLRFATREEVLELTGLTPGSIPPFGSLFGLPTYCDQGLSANEQINFNAGDHGISICVRYSDYAAVENPEMGSFAE